MQNLHVAHPDQDLSFALASRIAKAAACDSQMRDPTIIAWHQHDTHAVSHSYDGINPESWWAKYGEGNGGRLEVSVGDKFDFILMEAAGYETVGKQPVRNLVAEDGVEYICLAPMLGDRTQPNERACVPLDEWMADQY
ncbi:MAG: AF1514 family protein [Pseudomonadota bacterium]